MRRIFLALVLSSQALPVLPQAAVAPGTLIRNSATIAFERGGLLATVASNEVVTRVVPSATPSSMAISSVAAAGISSTAGPTQCRVGAVFSPLADPSLVNGTVLDPTQPLTLAPAAVVHGGDPIFLRLEDADQNRDPHTADTVQLRLLSGADREELRLTETGANTGVFVGYIQTRAAAATAGNCLLEVQRDSGIESVYVDPLDSGDSSRAHVLVDPFGRVFDSRTGEPVDGALVRLVDAATGAAATVYGDDGVSGYPAEMVTGSAVTDSGGATYKLPAGVYRFPLVAPGEYRLEVQPLAGHAFPSSLSTAELQSISGAPFHLGEGSFGRMFAVRNAPAVALDVPLDAAATRLFIEKSASTTVAAVGDFVQYNVTVENASGAGAFSMVQVQDVLPPGMRYRAGSTRIASDQAVDPIIAADGRTLTFALNTLDAGERIAIRYVAEITVAAHGDVLRNVAQASAAGEVRSNRASATIQLREELFRDSAIVVGRVVQGDCAIPMTQAAGVSNVRVYLEDGRYTVTDDQGRYHFDGVPPGSHVVQLDSPTIPENLEPQLCGNDVRNAGRAHSQFVDLRGGALWRVDFRLSERAAVKDAVNLAPNVPKLGTGQLAAARPQAESADIDPEELKPESAWLLPAGEAVPAIPSIKVAVQHLPTQVTELLVNGLAVSPLNFDGVTVNRQGTAAMSRWRGVDLLAGENRLVAVIRNADGVELTRLQRSVHYGGGAVRASLAEEYSTLIADGRTRPIVALRMIDASGRPARPGTRGSFSVQAPYQSWWEVESLDRNQLVAGGARQPTYEVDADGITRLQLAPTTQAGMAVLHMNYNERQQQEIRVWLAPLAREWILVGIAEGSAAHNRIMQNMQAAADAGLEDGYSQDGRLAFFAKGAIKGGYLLTLAYDSGRDRSEARQRLLGVIEPDRYYTLYGDAAEQRFESPSARKLYLKLERRQFLAMFGDFETGLTVTELTRYSRTLTGFKADYSGKRFGFTSFAAESAQGFVRDELRGDGTSGLYKLSRAPLVVNSDKIRIEVRDRIRTELVLDTRILSRHLDYDIDYLNGTLFFKQPVVSRDERFNLVFIVAEYEVLGGSDAVSAGGRAAIKLADESIEIGSTFVHQGSDAGDTRLGGADLKWALGQTSELRAEVARSESDDPQRMADANAYLAELMHVTQSIDARAYVRAQDSGFGVDQLSNTQSGIRKFGADGRLRIDDAWSMQAETFRQEVIDTGARRELAGTEMRWADDGRTLGLGLRHVRDSGMTSGAQQSNLAFASGSVDFWGSRATLRASQELALNGEDDSSDFPSRSRVGIDYRVRPEAVVFADYERAEGSGSESHMTRLGVRATPWQRTSVQSSLNQQFTESGLRTFSVLGLTHGWQVNERWAVDMGVDQSETLRLGNGIPLTPQAPPVSGTIGDDFLATFVGTLYRSELWTFTSRLERRDADIEERWLLSGGFYREPVHGHAFSLSTRWLDSDFTVGTDSVSADVRLAWAFRPVSSRWIVFDRLDLQQEQSIAGGSRLESSRLVNNFNASLQLDSSTQLGVQLASRYVVSTFDGDQYTGVAMLYGCDARRTLSRSWDVGVHATRFASPRSSVSEHSLGLDFGVTLAPNIWLSVGYNIAGLSDGDFALGRYTQQGPFIKLRIKADQDTFKDLSLNDLRP